MIAVLDVSAAVEILFHGKDAEPFVQICSDASSVLAPELYIAEIANVMWKYHKADVIDQGQSEQYVQEGIDLIDDFVSGKEIWKESLGEGIRNRHSVYDMLYLVVTRRHNAVLLTRDAALLAICHKLNVPCH